MKKHSPDGECFLLQSELYIGDMGLYLIIIKYLFGFFLNLVN